MEYRNELKYIVNKSDFKILETRLKHFMDIDKNIKNKQSYNIRSIYFDDYNNNCFYDNESGINERYKVRIRIYDKLDTLIKLEIKYKKNGFTKKEVCNIDKNICNKLIKGEFLRLEECNNKILNKLYLEQHLHNLVPKLIVEYDRTAYINKIGNVRVTFDTNIRTSKHIDRFFEDNIYAYPILEIGKHILEVKYDELVPDYIMEAIELNNLRQTAFSKYYLSRIRMEDFI